MKILCIHDDIYHINFNLVINCTQAEFIDNLERYHNDHKEFNRAELEKAIGTSAGCVYWDLRPHYYMWIKNFDWTIDDQAVVVHEINHQVDFVFDNAGIPIRVENTEVRAYYFEYLFKQVWRALKEYNYKAKPVHKKKKKVVRKPVKHRRYHSNGRDHDD